MYIKTRNSRIRNSKLSIKELSKKYSISYERVRQIIHNNEEREKLQILKIKNQYQKQIKNIIRTYLQQEIKRLSNKGRKKIIIIQKVILIRSLKDDFNYSFAKIARLFKNDYTTIYHLYHNDQNKIALQG